MPQIGFDPQSGRLTIDGQIADRYDPRLRGTAGELGTLGNSSLYSGPDAPERFRPEYYDRVLVSEDDAGQHWGYQMRPEVAERLAGRVQVSQGGVGGAGEVIDPSQVTWDDEFGALTSGDNLRATQDSGFSRFMNNGGLMTALALGGLGAIGQAGGFAGLFGGAPVGDVPVGGMLSESVAPTVTETMVGSPWDIAPGYLSESVAPQVTEPMALNPFEAPIINTGPLLEETVAPTVTEPMAPSPFDTPWWQDVVDLAGDVLGGGGAGGLGGVLGLGGEVPRIGDHAQINDPYGLMASGWGPWSGLLDTPKGKVVDALAKRQRTRGI